jgi:hypothetical protein
MHKIEQPAAIFREALILLHDTILAAPRGQPGEHQCHNTNRETDE